LNANGSNSASMFVILDSFQNRRASSLSADAIAAKLRRRPLTEAEHAEIGVFGKRAFVIAAASFTTRAFSAST